MNYVPLWGHMTFALLQILVSSCYCVVCGPLSRSLLFFLVIVQKHTFQMQKKLSFFLTHQPNVFLHFYLFYIFEQYS